MTRMTPLRLTILQFSQSFFTDARTFMFKFFCRSLAHDAPLRHVEGRHLKSHFVARPKARSFVPVPPRRVRHQPMSVGQFRPEQSGPEHFDYDAFNGNGVFARHVRISGSDPVTRTVCSKWADS